MSVSLAHSITISYKHFPNFCFNRKTVFDEQQKTVTVFLETLSQQELETGVVWVPVLRPIQEGCKVSIQSPFKIDLNKRASEEQKKILELWKNNF